MMLELLRNPTWQISAVIVLATMVVVLIRYQKWKNVKGIVYEPVFNTLVLSIEEEVKGKIQVLYNGKPVDDTRLLVLKIWNYGNISILPTDYILPITLEFGTNAEVLDTAILETKPSDLKNKIQLNISPQRNQIILKPFLLKRREAVELKILVTKFDKLAVSARINGVNRLIAAEELPNKKRNRAIERYWNAFGKLILYSFSISLLMAISITFINTSILHVPQNNDIFPNFLRYYPSFLIPFISIVYLSSTLVFGVSILIGLPLLLIFLLRTTINWLLSKKR